ncbi:ABC transporter related protein [Oscillochloris trichoides DG-6]|uniref:ABC transporter related protein n=1 Tax=Oscillochloris trichoides DG-6 TaxID=765420 RepID=E1IBA4_9CHLR|nr:ABC transporter ATP-binding protein [Oscillochloris trichoides]EFO81589.1 ABC transporter related protein [Oscillochloris trichoides DG-6]
MIEASQLSKQFGAFQAVRSINLNIQPGELLALLGPNGAGKTTTVRMLGAILKPSSGYARICGHDVVQEAETVRSKVGLLTEYPGLYGRMAAMEYLDFFGSLLGLEAHTRQARAELLLRQFGMWEARERKLDGYSKGMKQKIALVRALIHDPPVLFLDEPTTAMDPQSARTVRDAIHDLRAADRSILLTTHNLSEAEVLADRIAIIRSGQIIAQGTIAELTRQLLGAPIYELRLAPPFPASAAAPILADLISVESQSDTALRYRTSEPHLLNPQILSRLASTGLPVLALAEVPQRLEEVYLRIVAD